MLRKADEKRRLVKQNASLRSVAQPSAPATSPFRSFTRMRSMSAIVSQADAAARSDLHDPLTGESGTGKDVLADLLHSRVAAPQIP